MSDQLSPFHVCILAHNEEKNIAATIEAILKTNKENPIEVSFPVHVYANGCNDRTVEICQGLAKTHRNITVHEISKASKPNAWNIAFDENDSEFLIFSDGDVIPDPGSAEKLIAELVRSPHAILATCRQIPLWRGLSWQQKIVGFLQMPLLQNFLAGGFYGVRRSALLQLLEQKGYKGLPLGVTGEDCFLDTIVGSERLLVSEARSAYVPSNISDYCRYLARIRWQNEQIALLLRGTRTHSVTSGVSRLAVKYSQSPSKSHFLLMLCAVISRQLFKGFAAPIIRRNYRKLGPIREDGAAILQSSTRSYSSK